MNGEARECVRLGLRGGRSALSRGPEDQHESEQRKAEHQQMRQVMGQRASGTEPALKIQNVHHPFECLCSGVDPARCPNKPYLHAYVE